MIYDKLAAGYGAAETALTELGLEDLAEIADRKKAEAETKYELHMAATDREVTINSTYGASRSWYNGALRTARENDLEEMEDHVIDRIWGEVRRDLRHGHLRGVIDHLDYWSDRGEIGLDEAPERLDDELMERAPLEEDDGEYNLQYHGYRPEHRRHDPDFSPVSEIPHHI